MMPFIALEAIRIFSFLSLLEVVVVVKVPRRLKLALACSSDIPDSCGTMEITYVGFLPQAVRVSPEKTNYSIVLNSGYSELDEVVVVAMAPKKR